MSPVNLMVREAVNAAIFGLFICLSWRFVMIWYHSCARTEPNTKIAALALGLLCMGESLRSALAWFSLSAQANKWPALLVEQASPLWIVAGFVIMLGGLLSVVKFPSSAALNSQREGLVFVVLVVGACLALSLLT